MRGEGDQCQCGGQCDSPSDVLMRRVIDGVSVYERALIRAKTKAAEQRAGLLRIFPVLCARLSVSGSYGNDCHRPRRTVPPIPGGQRSRSQQVNATLLSHKQTGHRYLLPNSDSPVVDKGVYLTGQFYLTGQCRFAILPHHSVILAGELTCILVSEVATCALRRKKNGEQSEARFWASAMVQNPHGACKKEPPFPSVGPAKGADNGFRPRFSRPLCSNSIEVRSDFRRPHPYRRQARERGSILACVRSSERWPTSSWPISTGTLRLRARREVSREVGDLRQA